MASNTLNDRSAGETIVAAFFNDIHARENIMDLTKYNTGIHRMFNSVVINNTERSDGALQTDFGVRQKSKTLDFITDNGTEATIANKLLSEFKVPKIEVNVTVTSELARDIDLLDRVSINYPLRIKPQPGTFSPVVGITEVGEATEPLPDTESAS